VVDEAIWMTERWLQLTGSDDIDISAEELHQDRSHCAHGIISPSLVTSTIIPWP